MTTNGSAGYIGASLKKWRTGSMLTQHQTAEYLGVSRAAITAWETNKRKCAHPKLLALALAHYDCP